MDTLRHKLCARCKKSSEQVPFRIIRKKPKGVRKGGTYYSAYCNVCSSIYLEEYRDRVGGNKFYESRRIKRLKRKQEDTELYLTSIYNNIDRLNKMGWSLRRIEREAGISRGCVYSWKTGRKSPDIKFLARVAPVISSLGREESNGGYRQDADNL